MVKHKLRIVLATIGRFHSFDLARQLHKRSSLTAIFSGYPWFKLRCERLPRSLVHTFPWLHAPYMRFPHAALGDRFIRQWQWWDHVVFDRYTAARMPNCDLFSALSGSGLQSGIKAKREGAKYVCDRGSSHICYQDRILREEYDRLGIRFEGIDPRAIEREQAEYAEANVVTVPSTFVLRSFQHEGVSPAKVKLIPYGVDLDRFRPVARPGDEFFDVLFVGGVSVRKGIVYLIKAFDLLEHPRKRLTIIGGMSASLRDKIHALVSSRPDIRVLGRVPQTELAQYMSRSHVLVLPSIEEGLALVQAQAMACGCPVVATINTGAEDLFTDGVEGFIVPIRDPDAIAQRLQRLAHDPRLRDTMGAACLARVQAIGGWDDYGERMFSLFKQLVA